MCYLLGFLTLAQKHSRLPSAGEGPRTRLPSLRLSQRLQQARPCFWVPRGPPSTPLHLQPATWPTAGNPYLPLPNQDPLGLGTSRVTLHRLTPGGCRELQGHLQTQWEKFLQLSRSAAARQEKPGSLANLITADSSCPPRPAVPKVCFVQPWSLGVAWRKDSVIV